MWNTCELSAANNVFKTCQVKLEEGRFLKILRESRTAEFPKSDVNKHLKVYLNFFFEVPLC